MISLKSCFFNSLLVISFLLVIFSYSDQYECLANQQNSGEHKYSLYLKKLNAYPLAANTSLYREYGRTVSQNDFNQSLRILDELDRLQDVYVRLTAYMERLVLFIRLNQQQAFFSFLMETSKSQYFIILNEEIQKLIVDAFGENGPNPSLKAFFDEMMTVRPEWLRNPDLLDIYLASFERNDPRKQQIRIQRWVVADVNEAPLPEEMLTQFIRARGHIYYPQIKDHFLRQYQYRNYTYIIKQFPSYLSVFEGKSEELESTRRIYFRSLNRKRQYSKLLDILQSKEKRDNYKLSDIEAKKQAVLVRIKKGEINTARLTLSESEKLYPDENYTAIYFELASYYQRRKKYPDAVTFYTKLKEQTLSDRLLEIVQWNLARIYDAQNRQNRLKKIFDWSSGHRFESQEVAAKFCFWGTLKGLTNEGDLFQCYRKYPTTYYGYRSYHLYAGDSDPIWPEYRFADVNTLSELDESEVAFLQLLQLVYSTKAPDFGDILVRQYLTKNRNRTFFLYLSGVLFEARRYYLMQLMVEIYHKDITQQRDDVGNLFLATAYPAGYANVISAHNDSNVVPEHLVMAVIREESNFRSDVESTAGAVGLMQLMPTTATYIGKTIRKKITLDQLSDPEINILLGSAYLKRLINRYDGNLYYAIAAYNGGPTNVKRWRKKLVTEDMDQFVESIPFEETQNYVKRVIRSYFMYTRLYE